ncbi:MAG: BrnT family toxin [Planctomycetes bacterium]|nr:BrnT family toxin [Planctomycetota bacterium]
MECEWDLRKSVSNKKKHGIDFVEAKLLWDDPDRLEIPARTVGENRFLLIGRIAARHWSAVFTLRGDHIRIISVRQSREQEVEVYES